MSEMSLDARVQLVLLLGCQVLGAQQRLDALKIWDMRPLIIYQYRWFLVLLLRECRALKLPLGWTRVRAISRQKRFWTCWQSYQYMPGYRLKWFL